MYSWDNIQVTIFIPIVDGVAYWLNVVFTIAVLFPWLALAMIAALCALAFEIGRDHVRRPFADLLRNFNAVTEKLNTAEKIGGFGSFSWDFENPSASFWSEEMFNLCGLIYRKRSPGMQTFVQIAHEKDREQLQKAWDSAQTKPGPFSFAFRAVSASGQLRYLRILGTTTLGVDKRPARIQGVAHDVTASVEIDRSKTEFVSLAAHQLKTPLTSIKWFAEALLQGSAGPLTPMQLGYVENMERATQRMIGMVNDFLNTSRLELGTLSIQPEAFDVCELGKDVIEEQKHDADGRQVTLRFSCRMVPPMYADKNLVRMVLQNLISNAVKYTPTGGSVECEISPGGAGKESIFIRVSDTGIGIPKEDRDHVFDKLHRAANAQSFAPNGTGLGLYMVRFIVDKVGGGVTFESAEGKGTTFYVSLPLHWEATSGKHGLEAGGFL